MRMKEGIVKNNKRSVTGRSKGEEANGEYIRDPGLGGETTQHTNPMEGSYYPIGNMDR
jgi:hypothetical protein